MVIIKHFLNLSSYQDGLSSEISFLLQQKRKVHKVALSLQKAMNIIKRREIENIVRFSISSSTKEFLPTSKGFHYVVSIIYFNEFISVCQKNFVIDGPNSCETADTLSHFNVHSDRITGIRSVDTTQHINSQIFK